MKKILAMLADAAHKALNPVFVVNDPPPIKVVPWPPVPDPNFRDPPRWPVRQFNTKIFNAPLPQTRCEGAYIGWDEKFEPYVLLQKEGDPANPGDRFTWYALGLEEFDNRPLDVRGVRPVYCRLVGDKEKLIRTWAHSPMGPDPDAFEREQQLEAMKTHGSPSGSAYQYGDAIPSGVHAVPTELIKKSLDAMNKAIKDNTGK